MRNLIKRILVKLGLWMPKYEPSTWIGNVGWKWYGGHGIIGTGTVNVERSKEHEQT